MHFNDFWDLLRYFAFLGPKVEKERKVEFRDQKNPHEPLCFACFLSQRHHLWCLCPLFQFFSVLGVKMLHLMKFHNFSVSGLKNAKWAFLRFRAKIHPRNHYVYKVLSNFPAGMIFYHDLILQKGNISLWEYILAIVFSFSWQIHVFTQKASKKGIPFPGARARSEHFSSSRAHRKCYFPDFAPKSRNNSILAPKSQNHKNVSLLEQKWHFRPHGANPYKRNGFLGLLGPIFLISRSLGKIPQL